MAGWQGKSGRADLADRIQACCLRQGINMGELARRAGVSRTALYQIARGKTRHPQAATLSRIAAALGLDPEELQEASPLPPGAVPGGSDEAKSDEEERQQSFDRRTNTVIAAVYREHPALFRDWSRAEWEELYSSFGTGGELNEQGVIETARQMNRRRETVHRLQVVMETHLADVAENLVETLYRMVSPHSNLESTEQLATLLAEHQKRKDDSEGHPET